MLREVCFLIGSDGRVLWSDAGTSPVALPDRRARWEAIWQLREELAEIAHSHPVGPLAFSQEDETTMAALSLALPRTPRFSIVTPTGWLVRAGGKEKRPPHEPAWVAELRQASGVKRQQSMKEEEGKRGEP